MECGHSKSFAKIFELIKVRYLRQACERVVVVDRSKPNFKLLSADHRINYPGEKTRTKQTMKTLVWLPALTLLTSEAHAFHLSFYNEDNCAGEILGHWTGGPDQGCQKLFVGVAECAIVQSTGSVDDTVVAFYSSDTCDLSTAVAEGDTGEIAIDDFSASYRSFNVIRSAGGVSDSSGNQQAQTLPSNILKRTSEIKNDNRRRDDHSGDTKMREHGEVSAYGGKMYKWHQLGKGEVRGINLEEWDDNIHVKNDEDHFSLPDSTTTSSEKMSKHNVRSQSTDLMLLDKDELERRNFLFGVCAVAANCLLATGHTAALAAFSVQATIREAIARAIRALAQTTSQDLWGFFTHPYIIEIVGGTISSYGGGVLSILTTGQPNAKDCSDQKSDADTIISMIDRAAADNPARAVKATLQVGSAV